mgnify:CR=1 FL=1
MQFGLRNDFLDFRVTFTWIIKNFLKIMATSELSLDRKSNQNSYLAELSRDICGDGEGAQCGGSIGVLRRYCLN